LSGSCGAYNLDVEESHTYFTYFVGGTSGGAWVHNQLRDFLDTISFPNVVIWRVNSRTTVLTFTSQSQRRFVRDLPVSGQVCYLEFTARRFLCGRCARPFTEALPSLASHARYTTLIVEEPKKRGLHKYGACAIMPLGRAALHPESVWPSPALMLSPHSKRALFRRKNSS